MLWLRKTITTLNPSVTMRATPTLVLFAIVCATCMGWAKCADRTIIVSGNIVGENLRGVSVVLSVTSSSSEAKPEGIRQRLSRDGHRFRLEAYFDPTEGGIDNVCSRRPVLVLIFLRRGDTQLDAKEFRIAEDFDENRTNQTYFLKKEVTLHANGSGTGGRVDE